MDRPENHVVSTRLFRLHRSFERMGRDPHYEIRSRTALVHQSFGFIGRKAVLAQMHPSGAGDTCHIHPVIHKNR